MFFPPVSSPNSWIVSFFLLKQCLSQAFFIGCSTSIPYFYCVVRNEGEGQFEQCCRRFCCSKVRSLWCNSYNLAIQHDISSEKQGIPILHSWVLSPETPLRKWSVDLLYSTFYWHTRIWTRRVQTRQSVLDRVAHFIILIAANHGEPYVRYAVR